MGLFDSLRRKRGKDRPGTLRQANKQDTSHLDEWANTRTGVEAYVEPRTNVTDTTVVLVAHDGEWTRRRIADFDAALEFGRKRQIPVYEVARVGYPKRMRDYMARQKEAGGS
ncbi:oxidoreductase [Actinokineospora soli]|uniref:Oxidoreductase n=1 Tax=Actinokineospora soli TaxID=1048753 RepID=A0ABW2TJ49_9PSEU